MVFDEDETAAGVVLKNMSSRPCSSIGLDEEEIVTVVAFKKETVCFVGDVAV